MESSKAYRFKDNPKEKQLHDEFLRMFNGDEHSKNVLSAIIFGWKDDRQYYPKDNLSDREKKHLSEPDSMAWQSRWSGFFG